MTQNKWVWFHRFGSSKYFYHFAGNCLPWLGILSGALFLYGVYAGLVLSPPDYQQGDGFRIIYVHVPAAFLSLTIYMVMATSAAVYYIWKINLADMVAAVSAPIGASITFLALVTGAVWGKPMWGTWWVWDARLTSELILLFLYLGYMALRSAMKQEEVAAKTSALLAMVGVVNIPIIHFSVNWWNTLHQGATLSRFSKPAIHASMLYPLLAMIAAFFVYYVTVLMIGVRRELLLRDSKRRWVKELVLSDE